MHIEYKTTLWQKIYITNNENISTEEIINTLKEGNAINIYELDLQCENDPMFDTESQMTIDENDGYSTIELYDDEDKLIWENGI
jgi:hypothetical protein